MGRMLEPAALLAAIEVSQYPKILAGKRVLVTAGPTVEAIDPVRTITNISSGKMGYSIAKAAYEMGAEVTLISGPVALHRPQNLNLIHVQSAQDMLNAVMKHIKKQDIFISVAAVADYRPAKFSAQKIKKSAGSLSIELTPTEDILAKVASLPGAPFCVGFAAESENLLEYAEKKRLKKNLPLIVANLVQETMGKDEATLTLLDSKGKHALPKASKIESARLLLQHVAAMLKKPKTKTKPKAKAKP